jgi:hypothetical protein
MSVKVPPVSTPMYSSAADASVPVMVIRSSRAAEPGDRVSTRR